MAKNDDANDDQQDGRGDQAGVCANEIPNSSVFSLDGGAYGDQGDAGDLKIDSAFHYEPKSKLYHYFSNWIELWETLLVQKWFLKNEIIGFIAIIYFLLKR